MLQAKYQKWDAADLIKIFTPAKRATAQDFLNSYLIKLEHYI
jgi:hypothetical protein